MKLINGLKYLGKGFLFFSFLVFFTTSVFSQESANTSVDSVQVKEKIIAAENISSETEKLGERLLKLRKILEPSKSISEIDSILKVFLLRSILKETLFYLI